MQTQKFGNSPESVLSFAVIIAGLLFLSPAKVGAQVGLYDPSFHIGSGVNGTVYALLALEDGKVLVGGEFTEISGVARTNLARLTSEGALDVSFDAAIDGTVYQLLRQADGRVLIGGDFTTLQGVPQGGVGRLLTNGMVDSSFAANFPVEAEKLFYTMAIQDDGKILVGNVSNNGRLFRLQPNGELDDEFVQTNVFSGYYIFAIQPLSNGKILVGGGFQGVNGSNTCGIALLDSDGKLNAGFESGLEIGSTITTILPDGNEGWLVGGKFSYHNNAQPHVLAKLTPNLAWNQTFEPDSFDVGFGSVMNPLVSSLVRQLDGKIVVGGVFYEVGGYWRRHIVRLNANGQVDPCFDPGIGLGNFDGVRKLILLPGEKILAGGTFLSPSGKLNLERLLPNNECDAIRVYLGNDGEHYFVAGTSTPGGTNHLQSSTNLVDWITLISSESPYLFHSQFHPPAPPGSLFFRIKKEQ